MMFKRKKKDCGCGKHDHGKQHMGQSHGCRQEAYRIDYYKLGQVDSWVFIVWDQQAAQLVNVVTHQDFPTGHQEAERLMNEWDLLKVTGVGIPQGVTSANAEHH